MWKRLWDVEKALESGKTAGKWENCCNPGLKTRPNVTFTQGFLMRTTPQGAAPPLFYLVARLLPC
jgi:hypothetical protein